MAEFSKFFFTHYSCFWEGIFVFIVVSYALIQFQTCEIGASH